MHFMNFDIRYTLLILSLAVFAACSSDSDPVSGTDAESAFGIYFLADTSLTETEVFQMDIDELVLQGDAWLTGNDIEFYDYSSHCIYLKQDKSYFFKNYSGKYYRFTPTLMSRPFVVLAGIERCYVGAWHSGLLATAPTAPYIGELDVGYYPADVIHISRGWSDDEDIRSHPAVADVLIAEDLYHAGLELELLSFQLIDNADTATVEYSIIIVNNDQDDLYVIDPARMGSARFHYYTNGPHLWDYSELLYLYSQYKEVEQPEPYDSWNFEWFTLIKSHQSIERTIQLRGYPHIPEGNYVGYMNFSNPFRIAKTDRYVAGNRIWIGSIRTNDLDIVVPD